MLVTPMRNRINDVVANERSQWSEGRRWRVPCFCCFGCLFCFHLETDEMRSILLLEWFLFVRYISSETVSGVFRHLPASGVLCFQQGLIALQDYTQLLSQQPASPDSPQHLMEKHCKNHLAQAPQPTSINPPASAGRIWGLVSMSVISVAMARGGTTAGCGAVPLGGLPTSAFGVATRSSCSKKKHPIYQDWQGLSALHFGKNPSSKLSIVLASLPLKLDKLKGGLGSFLWCDLRSPVYQNASTSRVQNEEFRRHGENAGLVVGTRWNRQIMFSARQS